MPEGAKTAPQQEPSFQGWLKPWRDRLQRSVCRPQRTLCNASAHAVSTRLRTVRRRGCKVRKFPSCIRHGEPSKISTGGICQHIPGPAQCTWPLPSHRLLSGTLQRIAGTQQHKHCRLQRTPFELDPSCHDSNKNKINPGIWEPLLHNFFNLAAPQSQRIKSHRC